jgi:protein SCO1/2
MAAEPTHWTRRRVLGLGAAVAAGSVLAGCSLDRGSTTDSSNENANGTDWAGTLLDPPFAKPDVTFTGVDGKPFPFVASTKGRLTLLFFGYTNCPDVCPVYLNTLARARDAIGSGPGSKPQVLFVGVDVKRDTPAVMKEYLARIDPTFTGLTGSEAVIADAIAALKLPPVVIGDPNPDGSYDVGHPAAVTVFTKDDVAHRHYPYGVRQQDWVRDLPRLDQGRFR